MFADGTVISGAWHLRSFEVDIDLMLSTTTASTACTTSAWLDIDTLTSAGDRYHLREAGCAQLEFTASGDVIVLEAPTFHDWRTEDLAVDTDAETISLGPVQN